MPPPAPAPDTGDEPAGTAGATRVNTGPGRVLIAVYGVFAVAASARAGVQIATRFEHAPVAYLLSALAAVVYVAATVALTRGGVRGWRTALVCCTVELVGVLAVGTISLVVPSQFPDPTVWSQYGIGYGFVPLVLPVIGLVWLRRTANHADR